MVRVFLLQESLLCDCLQKGHFRPLLPQVSRGRLAWQVSLAVMAMRADEEADEERD